MIFIFLTLKVFGQQNCPNSEPNIINSGNLIEWLLLGMEMEVFITVETIIVQLEDKMLVTLFILKNNKLFC